MLVASAVVSDFERRNIFKFVRERASKAPALSDRCIADSTDMWFR
jgi:hypothetical protein